MGFSDPHNVPQMVAALSRGEEAAFRRLFDLFHKDVLAYSIKLVKEKAYAEEITQDVFVKVWMHREKLKAELSFKSFLFTITRNLCFNFLKKAALDKELAEKIFFESQSFAKPGDWHLIEADYERLSLGAINTLPPRCRLIFELSRDEGKSYEEISNELDISINTVKNQVSKALTIIRDYLMIHSDIAFLVLFLWNLPG